MFHYFRFLGCYVFCVCNKNIARLKHLFLMCADSENYSYLKLSTGFLLAAFMVS